MSQVVKPFSLGEKIGIVKALIFMVLRTPLFAITTIFRNKKKTRSYRHELRNRVMNFALSQLHIRQLQSILPATDYTIKEFCRKNNLQSTSEGVNYGDTLHWLGDKSALKVILYCHGGGYGLPIMAGHVAFLNECQTRLKKEGVDVVVAFIQYGLTPETRYPDTYIRAVECLRRVLSQGYQPENIIIGGDSAGGNLTLAIMSHLFHPHPLIEPIKLERPLAGILLISPWVTFAIDASSFQNRTNAQRDLVFAHQIAQWQQNFIDDDKIDRYSQPLDAPVEWWNNLPTKQVLTVVGSDEMFYDDIITFAEKIEEGAKVGGAETKVVSCDKELHIECLNDPGMGLAPGIMANAVWEWLDVVFVR